MRWEWIKVTFCVRGVVSPLLSNVILDELDQEMARRGYCFVRYADDGAPRRRREETVM
jgi:retron-type reverse transcriptase